LFLEIFAAYMEKFLLGKKWGMSQIWKGEKVVPVTLIQALPNTVSLLRTKERDGYDAIQLLCEKKRREFKVPQHSKKLGDIVDVSVFSVGDKVKISGLTKGRGFQGVVKRHGFAGGPKTHGQKNRHRAPGSLGATAPQRVHPGRRMAGRMGGKRVTIKNLEVVNVDKEKNILMVKGAVPGHRGTLLEIRG
jgi:large subunit ribosomal protein L3